MSANSTGRRQTNRLTDLQVKRAKPGKYYDGDGLFLVVDQSGARRWVQRLYVNGKRRDLGIGGVRYTDLAAARVEAKENRAIARSGGDPIAERLAKAETRRLGDLEARGRPTFEAAARECHEQQKSEWRNEKHRDQWISTLVTYAFPFIGDKRVDQVTLSDITAILQPIWTAKHATARRVRQRIGLVLDYATAKEWRAGENPTRSIPRGVLPRTKRVKKHHAAMPYAEVPAFIGQLRQTSSIDATKAAFETLILTAARTSEVLGAKWSEFDLDAGVWSVPANRMKGGEPHDVPLVPQVVAILRGVQANHSGRSAFVFESKPGRRLSQMALLAVMRRMGLKTVVHGFRSSFRDYVAEQTDVSREVSEKALSHAVRDKTEAAYFRSSLLAKRRALMQEWADFCVGPFSVRLVSSTG
jgi:integrase